ncbi:Pyridine nucleotide-disulfide oxidoreductase domain containing protein [Naviculisporaceae sp. PSN 640]
MPSLLIIRRQGCSGLRVISSRAGTGSRQWNSPKFANAWVSLARQHHVSAIVIGGGPAGVAAVGNLLNQIKPKEEGQGKIAWIDNAFQGGRINAKYRDVPSNTKAGLFFQYANALGAFRAIFKDVPKPNAVSTIRSLTQDDTCSLHYAGDMLQQLTDGLRKNRQIDSTRGQVTSLNWDESTSTWSLKIRDWDGKVKGEVIERSAPLVVYCTGSHPATTTLPVTGPEPIDLDTALKPTALFHFLNTAAKARAEPLTIGVIGASHSAILALINLVGLQWSIKDGSPLKNLRIKWFSRTPNLKYAEYKDGYILYDNTGLKGTAANFARKHLEGDKIKTSRAGQVITRIDCSGGEAAEQDAFVKELPGCDFVVQAIGFEKNPLPALTGDNAPGELVFNHETGGFHDKTSGKEVQGLFGAGIAFPERVVDPEGNVEHAVGFFKFMKFLKRVVPQWVDKTGARGEKKEN